MHTFACAPVLDETLGFVEHAEDDDGLRKGACVVLLLLFCLLFLVGGENGSDGWDVIHFSATRERVGRERERGRCTGIKN